MKIYVVMEASGDGYNLDRETPIAWFLKYNEADDYAEKMQKEKTVGCYHYSVEGVWQGGVEDEF